jgi:MFS family permease
VDGAAPTVDTSLRAVFAGPRGRLLAGLLLAELAGAIQVVAVSGLLPLAAQELHGRDLYGAVLAAGPLATIAVLVAGPQLLARLGAARTLFAATAGYAVGVVLCAAAPAMGWVLVGSVLRGLAGGLLVGLGVSAIGGLFEDHLRPRALGLFAVVWLVPSLAGPVANAVIAAVVGWRWALVWPVVPVVAARLLLGRHIALVPVASVAARVDVAGGAALVAGLVVASAAAPLPPRTRPVVLVAGVGVAVAAVLRLLRDLVGRDSSRSRTAVTLLGLSAAFFGLQGVVSVAVLDALDLGIGASSLALAAGLFAWAATGLRPPAGGRIRRVDAARAGAALVTVAAAVLLVAVAAPGMPAGVALAAVVGGFGLAGLGMGLAYPLLSARPFDDLAADRVPRVAAGISLAEMVGTVLGAVAGGGTYSLVTASGGSARGATAAAFAALVVVSAGTFLGLPPAAVRRSGAGDGGSSCQPRLRGRRQP